MTKNWPDIHQDFTSELQQKWEDEGFNYQQVSYWAEVWGEQFKPQDYGFFVWLVKVKSQEGGGYARPEWWERQSWTKERQLRRKYQNYLEELINEEISHVDTQQWLDQNYPKEQRKGIREIYLTEPNLVGELDLADFTYLLGVIVYISPQVDETKLVMKNQNEKTKIIQLLNAQKYINQKYPSKKDREKVTKLEFNNFRNEYNLEGSLDLSDFVNLKSLECWDNKLISLNLSNCSHLIKLSCGNNLLTNLTLPTNPANLKVLNLRDNNFPAQDLSFLVPATNLEELWIGNLDKKKINQGTYNRWTGSLDYLTGMKKLRWLAIRNTDINEIDITKLPASLKEIRYSTADRPTSKLTAIVPQLKRYFEYGRCQKCQQLNTNENWCQPCQEKEWTQDLQKLTGRELIEKFLERQPTIYERNKLKWIPYEQFANIEYLAEGGFSKVYKAKWTHAEWWKNEVALKIFNNSQNITLEFLTEIANNKLVDSDNNGHIVQFHGISQDPQTKNYIVVMEYISEGNLRQYLKDNVASKLSWDDKFTGLFFIAGGLRDIHKQGLVHRNLHSGNILNSGSWAYITDLGLSQPANSQSQAGQIFGVLPYVAPEVLRGEPYTQASDIYSFGIIMYEIFSGLPPYYDVAHDEMLTSKICQGLRPQFPIKIPQLLGDLINRCWDADPQQRPSAGELDRILRGWYGGEKNTEFTQQLQSVEEYNQDLPESIRFPKHEIHPGAVYHSRLINTKNIANLLQKTIDFSLSKLNTSDLANEPIAQIEIAPKDNN